MILPYISENYQEDERSDFRSNALVPYKVLVSDSGLEIQNLKLWDPDLHFDANWKKKMRLHKQRTRDLFPYTDLHISAYRCGIVTAATPDYFQEPSLMARSWHSRYSTDIRNFHRMPSIYYNLTIKSAHQKPGICVSDGVMYEIVLCDLYPEPSPRNFRDHFKRRKHIDSLTYLQLYYTVGYTTYKRLFKMKILRNCDFPKFQSKHSTIRKDYSEPVEQGDVLSLVDLIKWCIIVNKVSFGARLPLPLVKFINVSIPCDFKMRKGMRSVILM